ncbi:MULTISPECIES: hypothetical protein [Lactococcus]|uniref:hypothetical protein n=1 Tax=Lactococcus TaxID=1357 RepID=UPI000EDCFAC8|nr:MULTISPECIES: hypothetical protein [Lactococcus]HAP15098.1 hypothetical protein [Lactococcus sp.]
MDLYVTKTITGKFEFQFEEATKKFMQWLLDNEYDFSYKMNSMSVTVKFTEDDEFDEAVAMRDKLDKEANPQMTLDLEEEKDGA